MVRQDAQLTRLKAGNAEAPAAATPALPALYHAVMLQWTTAAHHRAADCPTAARHLACRRGRARRAVRASPTWAAGATVLSAIPGHQ